MNIEGTDIALAESVTPRGVHAYLAANGWMKVGPYHGNTGDVYSACAMKSRNPSSCRHRPSLRTT